MLSRILQRLAVVVGAIGLLVFGYAFIVNYQALTAWSPPESDFATQARSAPVSPTGGASSNKFDPGSAVPAVESQIPFYETVEGRRKVAQEALTFDAVLCFLPTALLFALAWIVRPPVGAGG